MVSPEISDDDLLALDEFGLLSENADQIGVRGTPEQDFMAEIDHPVPDLRLRRLYRDRLLAPVAS